MTPPELLSAPAPTTAEVLERLADREPTRPTPDRGRRHRRKRPALKRVLVIVGIAVLLGSTGLDVGIHRAEADHVRSVAQTRSMEAIAAQRLAQTLLATTWTVQRRNDLQASLVITDQTLLSANSVLDQTRQQVQAQGLSLATLNACLQGVQGALTDINQSNQSAAITAISDASQSCLSLESGNGSGPVYPFDFPDPFVLNDAGVYYAYGTNSAGGNIQILTSRDLTHWTLVGNALPQVASWAVPDATWAPAVLQLGSTFLLYYTVQVASTGQECISVASSQSPAGPFADASTAPLVCQGAWGGSIDPDAYTSPSGQLYLIWKSNGASGHPPTIWSQPLAPDGLSFLGAPAPSSPLASTASQGSSQPTPLLQASQGWEAGNVEAPDMFSDAGTTYLLYSGNSWNSGHYAIGYAVCQSPSGPCTKPSSHPILSSTAQFVSPGGATEFVDSSGQLQVAFHAYLPDAVGYPHSRLLYLRQLSASGSSLTISGSS